MSLLLQFSSGNGFNFRLSVTPVKWSDTHYGHSMSDSIFNINTELSGGVSFSDALSSNGYYC